MAFKEFKVIRSEDREINQLQENIRAFSKPIVDATNLDRKVLISIILTAGKINKVPHTLGYNLSGWQVVTQSFPCHVWSGQNVNPSANLFLYLYTSADTVADLEVF